MSECGGGKVSACSSGQIESLLNSVIVNKLLFFLGELSRVWEGRRGNPSAASFCRKPCYVSVPGFTSYKLDKYIYTSE